MRKRRARLKEKILIRLAVVGFFISGRYIGWVGDVQPDRYGYFFVIPLVLSTILLYDVYPLVLHRMREEF